MNRYRINNSKRGTGYISSDYGARNYYNIYREE